MSKSVFPFTQEKSIPTKERSWEPPLRFHKDPNFPWPGLPALEICRNQVPSSGEDTSRTVAPCKPEVESDDETETILDYPALDFKDRSQEPPSTQSQPVFQVPPLPVLCQSCDSLVFADEICADTVCSKKCSVCKGCLCRVVLAGQAACPICGRWLEAWEQDIIAGYTHF